MLADELGAHALAARRRACRGRASRWRRRRAARRRPRRTGRSAGRARRSRPACGGRGRSRPGGRARAGTSMTTVPASASWTTSQPSRRSSSPMISTSRMSGTLAQRGRALGQQRGRHELQDAVLRAGDVHLTDEPRSTDDPEPFHGASRDRAPPTAAGVAYSRPDAVSPTALGSRSCVGMVNLTRIYTRTGDDGTTALGDMSRRRRPTRGCMAYADVDEANSHLGVALAPGEPRRRRRRPAHAHPERPLRRGRRPLHAGRPRTRRTRRCASRSPTSTRLEAACDDYNERLEKLRSLHPPRRYARRRRAARRAHRRSPRRAGDLGRARGRTATR